MKKPPLSTILIRHTLFAEDLEKISNIHAVIYSEEYGYGKGFEDYVREGLDEFYANYDPDNDRVWVCEEDGVMIGFMLGMNRGDSNQLRYFVIEKKYRGIGLGNKLMNNYVEWVKMKGYKASYLWTTSELSSAGALYKRYGFVLAEEIESDRFGKKVTEQKYELKLK